MRLVQWCNEQANTWENALNPKRRRQWAAALAAERATEESGNDPPTAADLEPRLLQFALIQFEAERQTLVQAFDWAAETQQWQASVALAANLAPFFQLRGYWGDWVSTHQQAIIAARQADDPRGEGQSLNNLGNVYKSQGKWSEAIECYEQSLQIKRAIGDVHGEGQSLNNLGVVYELQKHLDQATALWQEALTKLHPDSPEHATVTQRLQAATPAPPPSHGKTGSCFWVFSCFSAGI
ncbi:MAG: tetratricopeptide repeat protein [Leptolyngbyaceae cyanobacterium CRU_2_3]|nr:tetratricopeptide repeat protein [Leptolyngbyaceae cyanobacterium CRU_2_3]